MYAVVRYSSVARKPAPYPTPHEITAIIKLINLKRVLTKEDEASIARPRLRVLRGGGVPTPVVQYTVVSHDKK